jgi:uncharacterized protein YndB with AHSA1/START domain
MVLKVILVIVAVIAAVLLFAATKPDTFRIERTTTIQATPDKIFGLIDDLHNWPLWAPQDREDSTIKRTFSGPERGVGAMSGWSGSGSTGKGQMLIVESTPPKSVIIKVDFEKPFAAHNVNEFMLVPEGSATRVTWSMHGSNLYMMKLMGVFTNMDRMMGKHFEVGLVNLKAVAEK